MVLRIERHKYIIIREFSEKRELIKMRGYPSLHTGP